MEKLVTLNISGEFDKGFVVQAEVRQDGGTTKNQVSPSRVHQGSYQHILNY
ncbi:MAG: hypothetical protein P7H58_11275 [Microcoleus anatoxicus]